MEERLMECALSTKTTASFLLNHVYFMFFLNFRYYYDAMLQENHNGLKRQARYINYIYLFQYQTGIIYI